MPRNPAFSRLLVARALSTLGDIVVPVAVAFAVLDNMHGGSLAVGVVISAELLGTLSVLLIGGVVADRLFPVRSMIGSDVASVVTQTIIAVLLATGSMTLAVFATLLFIKGLAAGFFRPASQAMLRHVVEPADMQRANALLVASNSAAVIVGPLVAGLLVASWGPATAIMLDAVTFALSAALLARLAPRTDGAPLTARPGLLTDLRHGVGVIAARRWLWSSILVASLTALMASGPLLTITPIVAHSTYGGPGGYSWLVSALGVGAAAGSLIAARMPVRRPLLVATVMLLVFGAAPLALACSAPIGIAVAGFGLVGASQAMFGTLWSTTINRTVPTEALGRVFALDGFGSFALRPIGQALGGAMAGLFGSGPVLWMTVAVFVAAPLPLLALAEIRAPLAQPATRLD